jgi:signal transduction histidine kinase
VYIVKKIVKINFVAIFLDDRETKVYRLKAIRDSGGAYGDITFLYEHPFIAYLKDKKEPVTYEELPLSIRQSLSMPLHISLIVPSLIEDNLLGFVFLGDKLNQSPYSDDDVNVFKILAHQAALAIENCFFFEEFKSVQEKIFTAEKLASIGGMADGVAHQMKNRLNHFSVASGELQCEIEDFIKKHTELVAQNPDLQKTFDYLNKIADSLIANVKRTDGVLKGILNYARVEEKETFFSYFSLKEIIDLSLDLLRVKHQITIFPLETKLNSDDTIYGVKSQIMEAIYNILDNAYEAILEKKSKLNEEEKNSFQPLIELKLAQNNTYSRIEISDNGIGIKEETKHKIFSPFFTTKSSYKSGTGIGMYVVGRIIKENHKGKIWFESSHMQGTRFFIELSKK